MSSSRWCRCFRSALNGLLPAAMRRTTASPKSSVGTIRIAIGSSSRVKAGA